MRTAYLVLCAAFAAAGCYREPPGVYTTPGVTAPQTQTAAPAPRAAGQAPAPPTPVQGLAAAGTVPAGTRLLVRLDQPLDSARMPPGQRFSATLEADLLGSKGERLVPAGSTVFGQLVAVQSSGRVAGQSQLDVAFTDVRINGTLVPIQAQGVKAVSEATGRDTARKVGAGALVGAAFGGGSGALKGAAVGGAVAILTKGAQVNIPAGTLLEVLLGAPLVIR